MALRHLCLRCRLALSRTEVHAGIPFHESRLLRNPASSSTVSRSQHRTLPSSSSLSSRSFSSHAPRQKDLAPPPKPTSGIAGRITSAAPRTTETYVAFGVTSNLFRRCDEQAAYFFPQREKKSSAEVPTLPTGEELGLTDTDESWWHDELGLQPTFSTWSQVCMLHMYIILVRLRALPSRDSCHIYHQHLLDHFTYEAEDKMTVLHNMTSSSIRNKYLKDIYLQWRGLLASYDEGLIKGDAVLGAAIWRNLWKADKDADWTKIAQVVAYMRRLIRILGEDEDGQILARLSGVAPSAPSEDPSGSSKSGSSAGTGTPIGSQLFKKIQKEQSLVAKKSEGVSEPFSKEDDEVV